MNIMLGKVRKDSSLMMNDLVQQKRREKGYALECRVVGWWSGMGTYTVGSKTSFRQQSSNFPVSSPDKSNTVICTSIQVIISDVHLYMSICVSAYRRHGYSAGLCRQHTAQKTVLDGLDQTDVQYEMDFF